MAEIVCQRRSPPRRLGRSRTHPAPRRGVFSVSRSSAGRSASRRQASSKSIRPPGPDIVARSREQHGVAKCRFILDTARLSCRYRGSSKCQPLPPRAGPSLLSADHRVECADGGAGGERDILKGLAFALPARPLRIGDGPAQPGRAPAPSARPPWRRQACRDAAADGFGRRIIEKQDES